MKPTGRNHGQDRLRSRGRGSVVVAAALLVLALGVRGVPEWPGTASARADDKRSESRLYADKFIDRTIDGEKVSCMYGHVFIDRDTFTARADTAFHFRERNVYRMRGNIVLTRLGSTLTCDQASFDKGREAGNFFGNVRIVEGNTIGTGDIGQSRQADRILRLIGNAVLVTPDYTVRGDSIFQDRLSGVGEAFGNVRIIQPGGENLVTGDHAVFSSEDSTMVVDVNPVFTSREQAGGTLTSEAELMRFMRTEDKVVMVDSVLIHQGQMRAKADTAVVLGREHLVLTGSPEVTQGGTSTMRGDRIDFFYLGDQLREIVIVGSARMEDGAPDSLAAIYQGLPSMDILEGDSITVEFEESKISRSVVVGNARSQFTPLDLDEEVATNNVSGDTIIIHFRDQRVRRVKVMGNADGQYRFAKVSAMLEVVESSSRLADQLIRSGAESEAVPDSLTLKGLSPALLPEVDSLLAAALDTLASAGFDTSRSALDFTGNAETVDYSGGTVTFEMSDRTMELTDDAQLTYGTLNLKADHILLDTDDRELYAEGEPLVEDSETIAGDRMGYNFEHKTAAVEAGVTTFDNYYYVGDGITRFSDQTMKIRGGRMTSCDLARPHFNFWSHNMKMRPEDKVVAAPVVLNVGHVPIFALPFYYKSLKSGRQSGILFPSFDFGWSSREGRYIRDFGYYWATNDYMDFIFEGDYNENQDFGFRIQNRYVKRYSFNGGFDYSRKIGLREGSDTNEWQLRWNHNQPTLFDDYRFRADVQLASTTLTGNDLSGSNTRDIVSGQLNSNVFVSRNWSFGSANLSASRREFTNAEDTTDPTSNNRLNSMTLPSVSMNLRQITLAPALRGGQKGSTLGNVLRNTYFQHSYSLNADSEGYELRDTKNYRANGNWSLSVRPPRVSIFNVSFTGSAGQQWSRYEQSGQVWVTDDTAPDGGFFADADSVSEVTNPSLSFTAGLGTTLYGLFPVELGRMRALRHTLALNTSYSLRPGLGDKQAHGTSMGFNMNNRFDLKYLSATTDSTLQEKKLDGVLDWSLSTSFNPKLEPGRQWSDISSGMTVKPGQSKYLRLKVSNTIDPYGLALKSTRFSYGLNFNGKLDVGEVAAVEEAERSKAIDRLGVDLADGPVDTLGSAEGLDPELVREMELEQDELFDGEESSFYDFYDRAGRQEGRKEKDPTEGGRIIPFDVSASFSYSYTNATQNKRASGNLSFRTNITQNWEFRYQTSFDLVTGSAIRQQYSIHRDLHCWRMEFNRTISTVDSQFGFRFYLKSIPSLKLTRGREDYMGSLGGGLGGNPF